MATAAVCTASASDPWRMQFTQLDGFEHPSPLHCAAANARAFFNEGRPTQYLVSSASPHPAQSRHQPKKPIDGDTRETQQSVYGQRSVQPGGNPAPIGPLRVAIAHRRSFNPLGLGPCMRSKPRKPSPLSMHSAVSFCEGETVTWPDEIAPQNSTPEPPQSPPSALFAPLSPTDADLQVPLPLQTPRPRKRRRTPPTKTVSPIPSRLRREAATVARHTRRRAKQRAQNEAAARITATEMASVCGYVPSMSTARHKYLRANVGGGNGRRQNDFWWAWRMVLKEKREALRAMIAAMPDE